MAVFGRSTVARPVGPPERLLVHLPLAAAVGVLALLVALPTPEVAAGVVAALVVLVLGVIEPLVMLGALLLLIPLSTLLTVEAADFAVTLVEPALLVLVLVWLARGAAGRDLRVAGGRLYAPLLLMVGAVGLSTLVAARFGLALKEVVKWLELLAVYLITLNGVRRDGQLAGLLAALLLAGAGEALYGTYQFATGQGPSAFALGETLRAFGHFEQPNPFAGYLGLILPFAVALSFVSRPTWLRALALLAGLALTVGIGLSQSRGAWLGVLTALSVMALAGTSRARQGFWPAVYALLLLANLVLAGLLPAAWTARLTALGENFGLFDARTAVVTPENFALVERMAHWQAGWSMFVDHPLLGVGAGNYPVAYDYYSLPGWREALGHAHNYYLNVAAESGLPGLIALLFLLVVSYHQVALGVRARSVAGLERAALLGALGCLAMLTVHNLFDNLFVHGLQIQIGFVLGLIARPTRVGATKSAGAVGPPLETGVLSSSS